MSVLLGLYSTITREMLLGLLYVVIGATAGIGLGLLLHHRYPPEKNL